MTESMSKIWVIICFFIPFRIENMMNDSLKSYNIERIKRNFARFADDEDYFPG